MSNIQNIKFKIKPKSPRGIMCCLFITLNITGQATQTFYNQNQNERTGNKIPIDIQVTIPGPKQEITLIINLNIPNYTIYLQVCNYIINKQKNHNHSLTLHYTMYRKLTFGTAYGAKVPRIFRTVSQS